MSYNGFNESFDRVRAAALRLCCSGEADGAPGKKKLKIKINMPQNLQITTKVSRLKAEGEALQVKCGSKNMEI